MKRLLLGTALGLVLGGAASAQDLFRTEMDPIAIAASDLIGTRVYAAEAAVDADEYAGVQEGWNDIGEINDVILSRDGSVDAVLVDIGGFLGMGERQVALAMDQVRFVSDGSTADAANDYFIVVNADRATLEGAPDYMRTGADAMTTGDTSTAATDPAMTDTAATDTTTTTEGASTDTAAATDGAAATTDGASTDTAAATDGAAATTEGASTDTTAATDGAAADTTMTEGASTDTAAATDSTATTDGTAAAGGAMAMEGYTPVDIATVTADQLQGLRVYGPQEEDLGEISELIVDDGGMATQAIVDVGGFLGIGEKPVALNVNEMQIMKAIDGDALRAYVNMTQEQLEALPSASM